MRANSLPYVVDRNTEIVIFEQLLQSKKAEFVAVYGRRRIGKTYLINHCFQNRGLYFEVTGSKKASLQQQLFHFHSEFTALFSDAHYLACPTDWSEAFNRLKDQIEQIEQIQPTQKIIIFLDELPWLATARSEFLPALEYYWNRHFSRMPNLILIVCGSAASWMLNKIVNNKEGLYGRLSYSLPMQPFLLATTEKFLISQNILLPRKQVVEIFMVTGGVAKYLTYFERGKSIAQSISALFFMPHGQLFLEFQRLFQSLFDSSEKHIALIRALSKKRYGLKQADLIALAGLTQNGKVTEVLSELEASGFILITHEFGKQKRERKIRLIDEYTYFYLIWVEPNSSSIINNTNIDYWQQQQHSSAWQAWVGYAFENICLKHIKSIKRALGIAGVNTTESHWSHQSEAGGAEIDLVIERADNVIHLCEIKFSDSEYTITKNYAEKLQHKIDLFRQVTRTRKALCLTMITPYGVKMNPYYTQVVTQQLTLEDLFDG
ncbi:MAG: hypothetical protein A3F17_04480 [Gammaproteobacteria bacterium RIFCSPHIGHO2_12_FULL_41_15]|nr:MAG: hypothetical protein A3F17_04480 [Gammaproteobacteria bacterium RIFCSPHIGHO2_12_FULL_41_15]